MVKRDVSKVKVGVIGLGMMGGFHAGRYLQTPSAELVAIADIRPERLEAEEFVAGNIPDESGPADLSGVDRYPDGSQLIAEADVDMVDICLPTFLHARYTIEALEAGHHVLCEKPMALTLKEADQMIEAAREADRLLMIAQCIRFWPEYEFLRQRMHDGTFGKLLSLNMSRVGGRPIWSWEKWYLDPARSGGTILDLHIHDVDYVPAPDRVQVNYLLGLPDHIQATARRSEATGSYDIIHAFYNYEEGPQVHIHAGWSMAQTPFFAAYDAWFEAGLIRFDSRRNPALQVFDDLVEVQGRPAEYEEGDAYANEISYFLRCVKNDERPIKCPPESARDSLGLVNPVCAGRKEIEAIENGRTVNGKE
ncbi:MAG: Gfo/Idh/MocA family oxidoreductase [Chloroflexota bacterium]|nr:Gfo/Idh/MocA family oxidoreductase [Chloroflexota bacterium]